MILEVCCGNYYDAYNAFIGGANRVELCSSLHLGGLTPTLATLKLVKANTSLEAICIVRPRACGFSYNQCEIDEIFLSAEIFLKNNADGIVFGFLNEDFTINEELSSKMIALCHKYNAKAIMHRCYDLVNDPYTTIEKCIELKVDRILTSGQQKTAYQGKEFLKDLISKYSNRIEIIIGSGINHTNVKELIDYTKCNQVHSSCKSYLIDHTSQNNNVNYNYLDNNNYEIVQLEAVKRLKKILKEYL